MHEMYSFEPQLLYYYTQISETGFDSLHVAPAFSTYVLHILYVSVLKFLRKITFNNPIFREGKKKGEGAPVLMFLRYILTVDDADIFKRQSVFSSATVHVPVYLQDNKDCSLPSKHLFSPTT